MAEMTGLPIVPFVCHARSCYWMGSWDRFMAPRWATPIVYIFGEPIYVPEGADEARQAEICAQLALSMDHLRRQADSFWPCGNN